HTSSPPPRLLSSSIRPPPPTSPLFPYTTLFRSALHDPVPVGHVAATQPDVGSPTGHLRGHGDRTVGSGFGDDGGLVGVVLGVERSEEHTSELQSRFDLVCRLLLEKKKRSATSSS